MIICRATGLSQLVSVRLTGPLLVPTPALDISDHLWWDRVWAAMPSEGPVYEAKVTVAATD